MSLLKSHSKVTKHLSLNCSTVFIRTQNSFKRTSSYINVWQLKFTNNCHRVPIRTFYKFALLFHFVRRAK